MPREKTGSVVVAGVLLGVAVGAFGISFGLIAVTSGLTVMQACAMSLLIFTGASQFAAVAVVAAGGSPGAAVASALFLGARNFVYGLTMAPILSGGTLRRLLGAQLVIDESTALATAQEGRAVQEQAFWSAGLGVFVFWNLGTLLGAIGGGFIGDPATWGLDAAFPAAFVALIVPHLRKVGGRATALLGSTAALVLTPALPAGMPIVAAAVACLVGLRSRATPHPVAAS